MQGPQFFGLLQALFEETHAQLGVRVACQQPGGDERVGIDIAHTQRLAVGGLDDDRLTRFELPERCGARVDFIRIDPQVSLTDAALFALFQAQCLEC